MNSFECVLIFGRIFVLEIPILVFGGIYLVMNVFFFFMNSAQMSSEALHLAGFMVGVPTGLYMLTRGHVDCEGYDVISHWKGEEGKRSKIAKKYEKVQKAREKEAENALSVSINFQDQIDFAIAEGNLDVAVALQNKLAITILEAVGRKNNFKRYSRLSETKELHFRRTTSGKNISRCSKNIIFKCR